ncbi:hypothetical protein [Litorimonas sp.]|uniref:hypothetical protein n=1 Tax=Litorimonas sp. TaxID=1892381 RepID=UPI003A8C37AA
MKNFSRILRPKAHEIEAVRLQTEKARLDKLGGRAGSRKERAARLSHEEWARQLPAPTAEENREFMNRTENKAHEIVMRAAQEILEHYREAKENLGAKPHHVIAALQLTDSVAAERDALLAKYGHPHRKNAK